MPKTEFLEQLNAAKAATSLSELCELVSELVNDPRWPYDYSGFPVWGPLTTGVQERLDASSETGDIVSWDTRDPSRPKYLMRVISGPRGFRIFIDED